MKKRILGRMLARELSLEELGIPAGGTIIAARSLDADAGGDDGDQGPPISTLALTLPDYTEDA